MSEAMSVLLICWQNRINESADVETLSLWTFVAYCISRLIYGFHTGNVVHADTTIGLKFI